MGKISKIEIKVRHQIVLKENLLMALRFDRETLKDRIIATESEIKTLSDLLTDDEVEKEKSVNVKEEMVKISKTPLDEIDEQAKKVIEKVDIEK